MTQSILLTVHLHSILQRETPQGMQRRLKLELPDGSTLADVLRKLEIRMDEEDLLLVVNGRIAENGQSLTNGDEVHVIPAIAGGKTEFRSQETGVRIQEIEDRRLERLVTHQQASPPCPPCLQGLSWAEVQPRRGGEGPGVGVRSLEEVSKLLTPIPMRSPAPDPFIQLPFFCFLTSDF